MLPQMSRVTRALLAATLLVVACTAIAQPYPSRPVSIIVPYAPGGETDVIARIMAARLTEDWKRTVLVENRAGGGTVIGTTDAANAKPDGYTLLLASFGFVTNRLLLANLPYDPASLTPLTLGAGLNFTPGFELQRRPICCMCIPACPRPISRRLSSSQNPGQASCCLPRPAMPQVHIFRRNCWPRWRATRLRMCRTKAPHLR